jgi:THAP4-like, heme-binding beta-barrel domain
MALSSHLAPLVGTWRGGGQGTLPGMPEFGFEEEIRFEDLGSDLAYSQRAWDPESGRVRHAESGIWRLTEDEVLVATFASPRRTEVAEGTIRNGHTVLVSTNTAAGSGAKRVTSSQRSYRVVGDELTYEFAMTTGEASRPEPHLAGALRRVPEPPPSA